MKNILLTIAVILILYFGTALFAQISIPPDLVLSTEPPPPKILNLDEYSYYIYKGHKLTISGLIDTIIEERKPECIAELVKQLKNILGIK